MFSFELFAELGNGGRNTEWIDFNGAFNRFLNFLGFQNRNKSKPNDITPGTNGGKQIADDKVKDAITSVDKAKDLTKTTVESSKSEANKKEAKAKPVKNEDIYHISYDEKSQNYNYKPKKSK